MTDDARMFRVHWGQISRADRDRLAADLARAQVILDRISGALHDAGTVVPDDPEAAIRALIKERDELTRPMWIPWPEDTPQHFNTGTACDMLIGPCACGATHTNRSVAMNLLERSAEIRGRLQESGSLAAARSDLARERERVTALEGALRKVDSEITTVQKSDRVSLPTTQHRRAIDDARMHIRVALSPPPGDATVKP